MSAPQPPYRPAAWQAPPPAYPPRLGRPPHQLHGAPTDHTQPLPTHAPQPPGYGAAPAGYPPSPRPAERARPGWWRRNWWGLLLVVPLFVATIAPDLGDAYDRWFPTGPTERVSGANGQWVSFGGGRLRLVSLQRAVALRTHSGRPVTLPATVQVWQATLEIDAGRDAPLEGCTLFLEDARGRTFSANPNELSDVDVDRVYGCSRPYGGPESGPFTIVAAFVASSAPSAVRVTLASELPRYAWLTAPD
ncbi:hypothetical protein [Luedemannella helvata]|uniref:Uncharacterized protein n=1 Tax=Luedemannella helvata TaxID=349315 RepID=A0ABP4VVP3_9ACTN